MAGEATPITSAPTAPAAETPTAPAQSSAGKPLTFDAAVAAFGSDTTPTGFSLDDDDSPAQIPSGEVQKSEPTGDEDADLDAIFEEDDEDDDAGEEDSDEEDDEDDDENEGDEPEEKESDEKKEFVSKEEMQKRIKVKVNGVKKEYTLENLVNIASSGLHTLQKHNEFEAMRKETSAQLEQREGVIRDIDAKITPAWEALKKNDFVSAVSELAILNGVSTLDVRKQLMVQLLPKICMRLGISPEEATQRIKQNTQISRMLDLEEENEWHKEQAQRAAKKPTKTEPDDVEKAKTELATLQRKHGFSDKEMQNAYKWLCDPKNFKGGEAAITSQKLEEVALNTRICDTAVEAVLAVQPKFVKNNEFVDRVVAKLKENPDWTFGKLARWVDKKAQKIGERTKQDEKAGVLKDISRKALKGKVSKDGTLKASSFANPNTTQKRPMRFGDLGKEENYQLP